MINPCLTSVFEEFRELRQALSEDSRWVAAIQEAGSKHGWWPAARHWKRIYERFDPHREITATLVYETADPPQSLCRLDFLSHSGRADLEWEYRFHDPLLGWVQLTRFPHDSHLPSLKTIYGEGEDFRVLRYRPMRRCTLRRTAGGGREEAIAKVFPDNRGAEIFQESLKIWQVSLAGSLQFNVAQPLCWDAQMYTVWQGIIPGKPVKSALFSQRGAEVAFRMGGALASLSQASFTPTVRFDAHMQLQRSRHYAAELSARLPCLTIKLDALLSWLSFIHYSARNTPLVPIHGSPHMGQWLIDKDKLGLVDFDRTSLGERELDVATFIAEMDFEKPLRATREALIENFVSGYQKISGPLNPDLLNAYRAHKRLSKSLKAARSLRMDAAERAGRYLQAAMECVQFTRGRKSK